ncbi:MAG: response regulator [bacterium]
MKTKSVSKQDGKMAQVIPAEASAMRQLLRCLSAVQKGDFSVRLPSDWDGLEGKIADVFNDIVSVNERISKDLKRVSRAVGKQGRIGQRADFTAAGGAWHEMEESVNSLISDLVWPTIEVTRTIGAVARGDLTQTMSLERDGQPLEGEFLRSAKIVNTMIAQLGVFTSEVTRVAREVGTEGKLGGQAQVQKVSGVWKDLTESVNLMAGNLTAQVRNIAEVTIAVASGDLSKKITVDVRGEILQLKEAINTMVDQLRSFGAEVTRVAREVGTDGKLGGQAIVPGVAGTWKDLTDSVNFMASNLTAQVRNIAEVASAVARGDLSRKITVDVKGEILELKNTINTMVDQLNAFAAEVTRVAREVGTDGKLGGQALVPGVAGIWKDLTDNVNSMGSNLTAQVRNIAEVSTAIANGDLSKKITVDVKGEILELKNTINTMVDQLNAFGAEVTRVAREVGPDGKLGGQAQVPGVAGAWKDLTDNVNSMASNLTSQVRNIAEVATAVARGDLSRKITVDVKGEILELKNTLNTMMDQLKRFASEVTRVAREVGTDGKLGGQALVPGVAGIWKDLTDNVNSMGSNITAQVRNIAEVSKAIADGDLSKKITVDVKGEILELKNTVNTMVDQLNAFAAEVTRVAREVGTDGNLGGQALVPGVAGTWKDLTDNVNLLAANLTTQVRAIAEVATAVTQGDLTRSIQVEASGEVAELKDNINTMIHNLRGTTEQNTEQDWLKTNIANFTRMMQGQRDLVTVGQMLLSELAPLVNAQHSVVYRMDADNGKPCLKMLAGYAHHGETDVRRAFGLGESVVGQCALEKRSILLTNVPPDYIRITSGLGETSPCNIIVLPVLFEGQTKAVIELASLMPFTQTHMTFLAQLTESIGIVLNTIEATMRTEGLLQQSQKLATELQTQQKELQQTNEELAQKAKQLAEQNVEVERKNQEIEQARRAVEEKAAELALTSKYKSEFLANMSHELRTPLNSILILSQQLSDNAEGNLLTKQVEYAKTVYAAGTDLMNLINDILDLSKIESGIVTVEPEEVLFSSVRDTVERSFRHVAEARNLAFNIELDSHLPRNFVTDFKRLLQVLKNLLSNAFKFTAQGQVALRMHPVHAGWSLDHSRLNSASRVIAFEVRDTGIGIPPEKQKIIFEAFQQAEAGTSRRYGGTGLGLAISRELTSLLGGEIRLMSVLDQGSTFTLYLPQSFAGSTSVRAIPAKHATSPAVAAMPLPEEVPDDRHTLQPGEAAVLIVEDDPHYARVLLGLIRDKGFKGLVASRGNIALSLAKEYKPIAITLDVFLPDMLGWTVLSQLKMDPETRHIPVEIVTIAEERQHALEHGAFAYLVKPITTEELESAFDRMLEFARAPIRRLLVVEDDEIERQSIIELIHHEDLRITAVGTGAEALVALRTESFDCVVLDLRLPDISGFVLLEQLRQDFQLEELPIVVFTGKELTDEEESRLRKMAKSIIIKGVQSPERLLDETALFLHRVTTKLPPAKQKMLERLHQGDDALAARKVLVVDDDVRNIFTLVSLLDRHGMQVKSCETGREAIAVVEKDPDLDIVLMDIMMPEMDGYETIRTIRQNPAHNRLPIIALTAKAMKGDREKCLEAGASDYIAKPVNTEQLLSLMRVWLHR